MAGRERHRQRMSSVHCRRLRRRTSRNEFSAAHVSVTAVEQMDLAKDGTVQSKVQIINREV